jgi:glycosyltransferase involved in cell wall biosynthesis
LLLDVWRALACEGGETPKLVFVGERGRLGEQILDSVTRSKLLAPHVRQVSGLPSRALRKLLANASALLAPNHAEGYGIPLVDALAVGAPPICSDIPVFREVTQNCATFVSPLDGAGWKIAIRRFAEKDSLARQEARRIAKNFAAPDWLDHFSGVENFLDCL